MTNTASTLLILSLLFGSSLAYASTKNCKDGKCVAAFAKQEQSSSRQKEDIYPIVATYHNKESQHQSFANLQPVDNFISTDFTQNSITLDDQPLLTANLSSFTDEIDSSIGNENIIEEDKETIILLDKEPMTIEYQCANEQEVIVCDTELHECECV